MTRQMTARETSIRVRILSRYNAETIAAWGNDPIKRQMVNYMAVELAKMSDEAIDDVLASLEM